MLSFVIILTLVATAISGGIEYIVVKSSKTLDRWYTSDQRSDKIKAIIVSSFISLIVGAMCGTGAGGGVYTGMVILLSTGLGLATNTLTYNFFKGVGKVISTIKGWKATVNAKPEWMLDLIAFGRAVVGVACFIGRGCRLAIRATTWVLNSPQLLKSKLPHRTAVAQ